MKSLLILTTIAIGALCSHAALDTEQPKALYKRAIDPKTMDPTLLSVLSVLKTAIPMDAPLAMPTGDTEPTWYAKLPADVKSLLPALYPASSPAPEAESTTASAANASLTVTSTLAPTHITLTKTLQYAPSGAGSNLSTSTLPTGGATTSAANGTLATASPTPSPSGPSSTSAKNAVKTEMLAAMVWVVLGAGFFLFA